MLANAKEKSEEGAIPLSLNSKESAKNRESTREPDKDLPISIPFQVRQGLHKKGSIIMPFLISKESQHA